MIKRNEGGGQMNSYGVDHAGMMMSDDRAYKGVLSDNLNPMKQGGQRKRESQVHTRELQILKRL